MKDETHRQRIEEDMMIKNPDFDRFTKISFTVCAFIGAFIFVGLAYLAAGVSNIIK